jgi:S-adenosylmethionine decarboxylase
LHKGIHLLIDCRKVDREVCLDDARMLEVIAQAAKRAGSQVISQVRYQFGSDSPPGFAVAVLLDESHCSAHSYAELGLIALDIFTCGAADPLDVLAHIRREIDLGDVTVKNVPRFVTDPEPETRGEQPEHFARSSESVLES